MSSIDALIQAAEYIERRDRVLFVAEVEHGYASSLPVYEISRSNRRPKTKKSQGSRTTHNELEKNRRAHLRTCLEKLKDIVPLGPEASRHTTLGLLTKSKRFIKSLEEREKRYQSHRQQLIREQRYLRRRLAQLMALSPSRSESESSMHAHTTRADSFSSLESSSGVSTADRSPSSVSESDEVDVIGYTSNQSDSDSLVSGDSGVGVRARCRASPRTARARQTTLLV